MARAAILVHESSPYTFCAPKSTSHACSLDINLDETKVRLFSVYVECHQKLTESKKLATWIRRRSTRTERAILIVGDFNHTTSPACEKQLRKTHRNELVQGRPTFWKRNGSCASSLDRAFVEEKRGIRFTLRDLQEKKGSDHAALYVSVHPEKARKTIVPPLLHPKTNSIQIADHTELGLTEALQQSTTPLTHHVTKSKTNSDRKSDTKSSQTKSHCGTQRKR